MRGDSGVAGEGRVAGIPKLHSWGKYAMPLTNINSDWMSKTSFGLCIIIFEQSNRTPRCSRTVVLQVYIGSNTLFSAIRR